MNILTGIQNFLEFINEYWTMILSIITMVVVIAKKTKSYFDLSNERKIEIAKAQISEVMLMLVTKAECNYLEWQKAGSVKRSQVIDEVFLMYPILSKITNQAEIIAWIDEAINEALKEMRKIFEENKSASNPEDLEKELE